MTNRKDEILKALTTKHIETINMDKLKTVNGGVVACIVTIDLPG